MPQVIKVRGYKIKRNPRTGLLEIFDPDNKRVGSTQTETAARSVIRNDERRKGK
jgi:hypothetical protein